MASHFSITCDGCGADLTTTGNSEDWRLALLNQFIPSRGGIVTDMAISPILKSDAYFCSVKCFLGWVCSKWPTVVKMASLEKREQSKGRIE